MKTRYTTIIRSILRELGSDADPLEIEVQMQRTWRDIGVLTVDELLEEITTSFIREDLAKPAANNDGNPFVLVRSCGTDVKISTEDGVG